MSSKDDDLPFDMEQVRVLVLALLHENAHLKRMQLRRRSEQLRRALCCHHSPKSILAALGYKGQEG
ncbi:MAG: hypothetical protein JSV19_01410 [Phycisphaerales bacterium]|nr:MAG: hypothetical protein JSV19_01410 [Phycisphaerales bacterium]